MRISQTTLWMLCGLAAVVAGCGTDYYRVNDPAGTKEYYTTKIEQTKTGAIAFMDQKSGSVVTLQSSEVKKISEDEFKAAVKGRQKND